MHIYTINKPLICKSWFENEAFKGNDNNILITKPTGAAYIECFAWNNIIKGVAEPKSVDFFAMIQAQKDDVPMEFFLKDDRILFGFMEDLFIGSSRWTFADYLNEKNKIVSWRYSFAGVMAKMDKIEGFRLSSAGDVLYTKKMKNQSTVIKGMIYVDHGGVCYEFLFKEDDCFVGVDHINSKLISLKIEDCFPPCMRTKEDIKIDKIKYIIQSTIKNIDSENLDKLAKILLSDI